VDAKSLYRKVERMVEGLPSAAPDPLASRLAGILLDDLREALGLRGVAQFTFRGLELLRVGGWGEAVPDPGGSLKEVWERHVLPAGEAWTGSVGDAFLALVPLGADSRDLLVLHLDPPAPGDWARGQRIDSLVSTLHYALAAQLERRRLRGLIEEARAIQLSLLPEGNLEFGSFQIAAASLPAESVGGDLFDLIVLDEETVALAVADASGHGLPAALQARDVCTGLRMGVEGDIKIAHVVRKLNRVIHRSGLSTRFVSLVFAELEANGNFLYINAGHPAPLLLTDRGIKELEVGGMILGPHRDARYKTGFAHLDHGSILVLYTDGVIEHAGEDGRMFGRENLVDWLRAHRERSAGDALNELLGQLRRWGGGRPFEDDVTAMVVRRV
jgi:hypothetical protein